MDLFKAKRYIISNYRYRHLIWRIVSRLVDISRSYASHLTLRSENIHCVRSSYCSNNVYISSSAANIFSCVSWYGRTAYIITKSAYVQKLLWAWEVLCTKYSSHHNSHINVYGYITMFFFPPNTESNDLREINSLRKSEVNVLKKFLMSLKNWRSIAYTVCHSHLQRAS